jgi:hypothetical protein
MQAGPDCAWIRYGAAIGIESGHESEYANREQNGRRKCSKESLARPESDSETKRNDRPAYKSSDFEKVADRAAILDQTALDHRSGVEAEGEQQQQVTGAVVLSETLAPKENRIHSAQPVNHDCEQKDVSICKPRHDSSLACHGCCARNNSAKWRVMTAD